MIFATLYSLLSVIRHDHFQSQGIDFSIYDQALWLYSRFERAFSTVTFLDNLADRFRPITIPLSALYWFTGNERVLLIFQSIILSAAVFPIWLLGRRYLPRILAIMAAFLYVDFIGIQAATVSEFHEMALLPFFLAWLFYFLEREKWRAYFTVLLICLAVREHVGLTLGVLGLYVFFVKKNLKAALLTAVIAFSWSVLAISIIMPKLGQEYYGTFVKTGDSLYEGIFGYLTNPFLTIKTFFVPFVKTQTIFWSFFSFGLVPFAYLALLPVILFQFASRFFDLQHPIRWTLYYHYSLETGVFLAVATIYGLKLILAKLPRKRYIIGVLAILLLGAQTTSNIILHSPLKTLLKAQFYREEPWSWDTRFILSMVPPDATVASQNNLLPHLSHRREIYLLPIPRNAQYIVLDLHPGQNDWNFYTDNLDLAKSQFKELIRNGSYKPIASAGDAYILMRRD
ncbi:DUF2079 domain-containing protein [Candidatus Curtissbacteria bacterium]|nr:DUF2079 domain-containing protein [Candidatus Curtissbacteria bacterium]